MNNISVFFQKFLNLQKNNETKVRAVLGAVKKITGIELTKETLEIKGDNVKIKCNPVFRNEIFMRQSEIESFLKSQKIFIKIF